ncbi:MAG: DUF2339 domain-containing protein [Betaproteobacteria bacterium]|nr:DUF2339 domain-containing protein [Betaproteobacteria bacterium]
MVEIAAVAAFLVLLFYAVIIPVLAFSALSSSGRQKKEVESLKLRLAALEKQLAAQDAELRAMPRQAAEHAAAPPEKTERQPERRETEFFVPFPIEALPLSPDEEEPIVFPEIPFIPELPPAPETPQPPIRRPVPVPAPKAEAAEERPEWADRFLAWCIGGNPLVRVGIVILFFGVSFLLKLAVDHKLFPLELRLACVAAGAAVLLGIGWRLREKRRNYGLLLQGGGIGILYLVIYASFAVFKLFPENSALFAFLLLFAVSVLSAFLAVRQEASTLAVMGMAGGFAAPVLISTGSGNHIMLFSYLALLNASVFGIAWFRAWRALNLLGFVFTLGVGSMWGLKYYHPAHLFSVECFLILFFLFYVAVALLYAVRRELELKRYVDGTLLFGAPIAFSLLQSQLVDKIEFGMTWSMVALGALYLLLAAWLARFRLERLRLVFESMLALGVLFLTLSVPLAFEGTRLTAAIWAVEGAGLCWVAVRQQRRLALASGLILQAFAALSFFLDPSGGIVPGAPLALNGWYLGALMLALSALFCGWQLRSDAAMSWLGSSGQVLSLVLGAVGLYWWIGSGIMEIHSHIGPFAKASWAFLSFFMLTAWLAHCACRVLRWAEMEWVALALSPALLLAAWLSLSLDVLPLAGWGLTVWPLAAVSAYTLLFRQERQASFAGILGPLHALMFWTLCLVAALEFHDFVGAHVPGGVWQWSSWAFAAALLLLALIHIAPRFSWPVGRFRSHYLGLGAAPVLLLALGWAFLGFGSDGNPAPLPYLPLLNPVELCQLLVFAALFSWGRANREFFGIRQMPVFTAVLGGSGFLWLNAMLLRAFHHWLEIPYRFNALYASTAAQAALSLLWSLLALILMVWAVRRAQRAPWFVGISLLALTVGKLFFVELSRIGGTARIFSFIGVGALLLLIGYLAPLPPKKKEEP